MRLLLADDHTILRTGLRRIIEDAFAGITIGEVSSCSELLDGVRQDEWAILILDIALGDRNSLDLVPELRRLRPDMAIIVLSMYGERQFVLRAVRAGVSGYLTKERAPEELLRAIRAVQQGKRYFDESVAEVLAEHVALHGDGTGDPHDVLSSREYEVFLLLAQARSVSEIAAQLMLSVKTISTYRTRILEKMGMKSNAELMQYAVRHGLLQ